MVQLFKKNGNSPHGRPPLPSLGIEAKNLSESMADAHERYAARRCRPTLLARKAGMGFFSGLSMSGRSCLD